MQFRSIVGLTLIGAALAIGQWMIPPDTVVYEVRFAVVLMAIAMFLTGSGLIIHAWYRYHWPAKRQTYDDHIKGLARHLYVPPSRIKRLWWKWQSRLGKRQ